MVGKQVLLLGTGHGSQVPDPTGDEASGFNDVICPCDFKEVRVWRPPNHSQQREARPDPGLACATCCAVGM